MDSSAVYCTNYDRVRWMDDMVGVCFIQGSLTHAHARTRTRTRTHKYSVLINMLILNNVN